MLPDDADLVRAFRLGNRDAFAALIERHRARVVGLATLLVGATTAEDVAQEAAYQAYFGIDRLRQPDRFGSWLCGIAVNLAKMALRRRRIQFRLEDLDGGRHHLLDAGALSRNDPEARYEALELRLRVERALESLGPEMRAAVWLHYVEGLTYQEIASITGLPSGRLRVLSHRARQRLRVDLASEFRTTTVRRDTNMIELRLHDIRVMVLKDDTPPTDRGPERSWVVFLKEASGPRALAIWIGASEGEAIAMHLAGLEAPRPQTYTLIARLIEGLGGSLERASITRLTNDTFIAGLTLHSASGAIEIDARASDALNLALRAGAPIFAAEDVMDNAAFETGDDVIEGLKQNAPSEALRGLVREQSERVEWRPGIDYIEAEFERRREDAERFRVQLAERRRQPGQGDST